MNSAGVNNRNDSLVEGLLGSIYDRFNTSLKDSFDSDVFTEMSSTRFSGVDDEDYSTGADHESESRRNYNLARSQHLGWFGFLLIIDRDLSGYRAQFWNLSKS